MIARIHFVGKVIATRLFYLQERRKQKGGTLRRLLSWRIRKKIVPIEDQMITELEKVHFVIGNGLLRPGLR